MFADDHIRHLAARLRSPDGPTFAELEQAALALSLLLNTIEITRPILARHDVRVGELLEANNREVTRRRAAESDLAVLRARVLAGPGPLSGPPWAPPIRVGEIVRSEPARPAVGQVRVTEGLVSVTRVPPAGAKL